MVKEIPQDFSIRTNIYRRIGKVSHVRAPTDSVPERRMLVFRHYNENLLRLVQGDVPLPVTKRILKCALRGIAALHESDVVHNGNDLCHRHKNRS